MLEKGDLIINIVDSTNLERNLYLTYELLERDVPMVVALNLWDEAKLEGIDIDVDKLEEKLGVPVVPTVALTGEGIKKLVSLIPKASTGNRDESSEAERWSVVGQVVQEVQRIESRKVTWKDRIAEATIKPHTGIPIAFIIIYATFRLIRLIGEGIITYITDPFFEVLYKPLMVSLSNFLGSGIIRKLLIGELIEGEIEFMESMGALTTGLYVPFAAVLPYIIAFYFALSLLEDSGYLPRLATLVDNIFHRLGIHGQGIIPLFLGLGCNVPGVLATRALDSRRERFISATLLSIGAPCMAQTAMIFGILGPYGMGYTYIVFATLGIVYISSGLLLNRLVGGESPEIFLEIPPYRRPSFITAGKKTVMRVRWFLAEAVPWLIFGILLVNMLYAFGILGALEGIAAPVVSGLFGLPKGASSALLMGFLRKDLAVGMLLGLGMGPLQLVIASTILTIYFPCAATFATLFKELGIKDLMLSVFFMLIVVLVVGGLMRVVLL